MGIGLEVRRGLSRGRLGRVLGFVNSRIWGNSSGEEPTFFRSLESNVEFLPVVQIINYNSLFVE